MPDLVPLPPATRQESAASALRAAILRGTFKPGDKLDQQDLADRLGISRSPIREAIRTLEAEELVTVVPHRGAIVTERSRAELEELLFIRMLLEGTAARRAAPHVNGALAARLGALADQAEQTDDPEVLLDLNHAFHTGIYQAVEQPTLVGLIQTLRNKVAPYNRLYLDQPGTKAEAWADHRRILDACRRHDAEATEAETRAHLERVFTALHRSA